MKIHKPDMAPFAHLEVVSEQKLYLNNEFGPSLEETRVTK